MAKLYWLSSSLIFSLCITTALSRPRCGFSDVADSSGPLNFEVFDPNDPRCTAGSNCKFKNRDLTYRIKYDNKLSLSRSEVVREIASALKSWSKVTNVSFRQVFHEDAEIRISFHGNIDDFEGDDDTGLPGKNGKNYLAHAFLPRHGRLHFDINREWKTDPRKGLSLYRTALHEIGHILGLEHSNDNSSIMWKSTEFDTNELNDDDIAGIRALYGKPVSLPSDQQILNKCLEGKGLMEQDGIGTRLHWSSRENNIECVKTLLRFSNGQNQLQELINKGTDPGNQTPLWAASYYGYTKIVELLLKNGANVDAKDHSGATPLKAASSEGHVPAINLLLRYGAKVDEPVNDLYPWNEGETPLMAACQKGYLDVVKILIQNNANLFLQQKDDEDCAYLAAAFGKLKILKYILPLEPSLMTRNLIGGLTILHTAARNNHKDIVDFLLNFKTGLSLINDRSNTYGDSPLTSTIQFQSGNLAMVKLLISKGADANLIGNGKTPLEWAVKKNKSDIVQYLQNL